MILKFRMLIRNGMTNCISDELFKQKILNEAGECLKNEIMKRLNVEATSAFVDGIFNVYDVTFDTSDLDREPKY